MSAHKRVWSNSNLKIAFLTHSYPPTIGGKELATFELVQRLQRFGHVVKVYVGKRPYNVQSYEHCDGVDVYRLVPPHAFNARGSLAKRWLQYTFRVVLLLWKLWVHRMRWKWDIVHVDCTPDLGLASLVICAITRTPFVISTYGSDLLLLSRESSYKTWIVKTLLRQAAQVATVSDHLKESAVRLVPEIKTRIEVIHPGVDLAFFRDCEGLGPLIESPYILTVGRMEFVKGRDILIRAWPRVLEAYPGYRLVLTGEGRVYDDIRALICALDIAQNVTLWGPASREEIARLLHRCELHVLPSRSEGLPLAIIEGFACSKAVVASRVGGVGEVVIDGETGILVEPEDVERLAKAILYLLDNEKMRLRMGQRGYQVALEHDWINVAHRYEGVFQRSMALASKREEHGAR